MLILLFTQKYLFLYIDNLKEILDYKKKLEPNFLIPKMFELKMLILVHPTKVQKK